MSISCPNWKNILIEVDNEMKLRCKNCGRAGSLLVVYDSKSYYCPWCGYSHDEDDANETPGER